MNKGKRALAVLMTAAMILTTIGGWSGAAMTDNTFTAKTSLTDTSSPFYFKGSMSEETLKRYLSRAVTFEGLCAEGGDNFILDEDIRMLGRTGTKFVSRAALFAWTCTSKEQMEQHFTYAKKNAEKVHAMDPEIILQGFVAEIVHKAVVEKVTIPSWVFQAFGKKAENRCFDFESIINQKKGADYWGKNAGYPDWSNEETMLWYYYCIRRYIDVGYESIHIQEGEDSSENANVDKVLTMSRQYAKTKARRGLVLFHNFFSMTTGGSKIGNRLLFDIHGGALVPNETEKENGILKCRVGTPDDFWCTLFGRSNGGEHPLGFTTDICPTILEFDNYGQQGPLGVSNGPDFGTWGYDDITWFAVQPEAYRNEFLDYLEQYSSTHCLTKAGKRAYYILYPMRRVITPEPNYPQTAYTLKNEANVDFVLDYFDFDNITCTVKNDGSFQLATKAYYVANRQSDGCPNGFNQEDTIRRIFLGKNAAEDPQYNRVIVPAKYQTSTTTSASSTRTTTTTKRTSSASSTSTGAKTTGAASTSPATADSEPAGTSETVETGAAASSSQAIPADTPPKSSPALPWIIGSLGILVLAGAGFGAFVMVRKKGGPLKEKSYPGNGEDK